MLADIIRGRARGEEPFFATITMERGVEYTGRVVTPGGRPAAGLPYQFEDWGRGSNQSRHFMDDAEGRTDDDGRIRLRMTKSQTLAIHLGPPQSARARFPYAPYQHFWGTDDPSRNPDVWAPTDLGRIVLSRGIRVSGRAGRHRGPADRRPEDPGRSDEGPRRARGHDRGRRQLLPRTAPPGELRDQRRRAARRGGIDPDAPPIRRPIRVIRPVKVYLKEDVTPEPLVLHEMPTVQVEVRFVDSGGKPAARRPGHLVGDHPERSETRPMLRGARTKGSGLASVINEPEPPDPGDTSAGACRTFPVTDGRIVFAVPADLQQAMLNAYPFDEDVAYKTRLTPDGPLKHFGGGELGRIEDDRRITIVCYRAATVLVTLKSEDGPVPGDMTVNAGFNIDGGDYGSRLIRQPDGRYRGQSLMPDHEYEISAWQPGRGSYISRRLQRINLPEGGSTEVTLMLRKRPDPLAVGQPAPPFSVQDARRPRCEPGLPARQDGPAPLLVARLRPPVCHHAEGRPRAVRQGRSIRHDRLLPDQRLRGRHPGHPVRRSLLAPGCTPRPRLRSDRDRLWCVPHSLPS